MSGTLATWRVTWLPGAGDRVLPQVQELQAAKVEIDGEIGFTFLRDDEGVAVFSINHAFLVSIERITKGAPAGA